jgi:outer membrane protein assembly factor BamB
VGPSEPDTVINSIMVYARGDERAGRTIGILGTKVEMGAFALNEDGDTLYSSYLHPGRFSWSSSEPEIAPVDRRDTFSDPVHVRLVTGVREGAADITATSEGVSGATTVTVRDHARLAWSVPVGMGASAYGVVVGADGTIYVGTDEHGVYQSRWSAISPQGGILWTLDLPRTSHSTPAIGADGTLYIGSMSGDPQTGRLFAVNPGGTVEWVLEDLEAVSSSPALGPDGAVYVAGGQHLYAVDPLGEIQWAYEHHERIFFVSSPAVASDGTIYIGGTDGLLYAIDPDGSLRWTFETEDIIQSSPAIGTDGTIYFGSMDGSLYAVNPDGTELWRVGLRCGLPWGCVGISSSPSIGPDGTIYVKLGGVTAIDPEGSILWNYGCQTDGSTPILGADGTVYFTGCVPGAQLTGGSAIAALDAQGNLLWDYRTRGGSWGSAAIGIDGMIIGVSFTLAYEATVHAIVETSSQNGGFEGAPWPTARGNRSNTGRAGG